MNRKETTADLLRRLEILLNCDDVRTYSAREVTFDYATNHSVRVDFMLYRSLNNSVSGIEKGDFYCYEIKSSAEDFKSPNGHNYLGDYNYYVMPRSVYDKISSALPYFVGVYVDDDDDSLVAVRKARRKDRSRPTSEMLLMMFRSSRRDLVNFHKRRN